MFSRISLPSFVCKGRMRRNHLSSSLRSFLISCLIYSLGFMLFMMVMSSNHFESVEAKVSQKMNELLSSSGSGMISLKREQAFSLLDGLNALKDSNNASNYNNTYLTLQCATNPLLGPDNQYPKDGDPKNGFLWFMNGCHL